MSDQSELDRKYFIDEVKYNCPFCNRRSIVYSVLSREEIDWSNDRKVWVYRVQCAGCTNVSIHLSDYEFEDSLDFARRPFVTFKFAPNNNQGNDVENYNTQDLDKYFFYHQPTSFFTINFLIPEQIRNLVSEADGCRKMNFLVGASGALRKAIYELLKNQKAEGGDYQEKIKWFKVKYPNVFSEYFDALANIQDMTSDNLHEKDGSWKPWKREDFDYFLETVKAVLDEIYVKPEERKSMLGKITQLKSKSSLSENKAKSSKS